MMCNQVGNRAESNDSRVNLPQRSLIMWLSRIVNSRGRHSGATNAELDLGLSSHNKWTNEWGPDSCHHSETYGEKSTANAEYLNGAWAGPLSQMNSKGQLTREGP